MFNWSLSAGMSCLWLSAMSTAQSTENLRQLDIPTPAQLWVCGPLDIVTHAYHINYLLSLTVPWCANHPVMSISVPITSPHDPFTPLSASCSHLFSGAASLWGYTLDLHSLPDKNIPVLSSILYFMLASQSRAVYMFLRYCYPRRQQSQLFSESSSLFQLYQATEWIITGSELGQQVLEWLLSIQVYSHSVWHCPLRRQSSWGWTAACCCSCLASETHRVVLAGQNSLPAGSLSTSKSGWQRPDMP